MVEFYSRYLGFKDCVHSLSFKGDMDARVALTFLLKLRHKGMYKEESVIAYKIHAFSPFSWGKICHFVKIVPLPEESLRLPKD